MRRKKWVKPYLDTMPKYLLNKDLININFNDFNKSYLEIGCGLGDFIIAKAKANPDDLFIGYEKDEVCAAKVMKKAEELSLDNLFIVIDDANKLLEYFNDKIFDGIYLLFSDPWPKKGYYKRRLTYIAFLNIYEKILKDSGFIYFKTDNFQLYEFSKDELNLSSFRIIDESVDFHSKYHELFLTGYETKFIKQNLPIYYLYCNKENNENGV